MPTMYTYIGQRPFAGRTETWLRILFNYTGREWVFFERVIINVDGSNNTINFSRQERNRDTFRGGVWETADIQATSTHIALLERIAASEQTVIRFDGTDHRQHDFTLSQTDKDAIRDVLLAFDYLSRREA